MTERSLRARFRALVLELHPDRRPDDPGAAARLLVVVDAYERALDHVRGRPPRTTRTRVTPSGRPPANAPRERFRFVCNDCDDSFTFDDCCPRCDERLVDSYATATPSTPPPMDTAAIDALITALERRSAPGVIAAADAAPEIMAGVLFGSAVIAYAIFPPVGLMFASYVLFVVALRLLGDGSEMRSFARRAGL